MTVDQNKIDCDLENGNNEDDAVEIVNMATSMEVMKQGGRFVRYLLYGKLPMGNVTELRKGFGQVGEHGILM